MTIESKKQMPEKSEWVFVRKNSKGENIFRRDTHQTAEHVANVFNEKEIPFDFFKSASCFKLYNDRDNKCYQYYYSTGRWGVYKWDRRPTKHYHSKSVEDFLERFFFKEFNNDTQTSTRDSGSLHQDVAFQSLDSRADERD